MGYDSTRYQQSDPYEHSNGVLRNNLGITTTRELNVAESDYASARAIGLQENPIRGNFDLHHLQQIHKSLFQDVYPWAGEVRQVGIEKGPTRFCMPERIEPEFNKLHQQLLKENRLQGLQPEEFAKKATHYLTEINAIHPFREGNGRTQREFIGQIARDAGYEILWDNVGREAVTQAHVEAHYGEDRKLQRIIELNMRTLSPEERMAYAFKAHEEPVARREFPALAGAYDALRAADQNLKSQGASEEVRQEVKESMTKRLLDHIDKGERIGMPQSPAIERPADRADPSPDR